MSIIRNTKLKVIMHQKGNIRKILDINDEYYKGFGEVYTSDINFLSIKGWKLHKNKTSNFVVVHGLVKFVAWEPERPNFFNTYNVGIQPDNLLNYNRITIGPNVWFGFKGLCKPVSRVLNISNILNSDTITQNMDLDAVNYDWGDQ